MKYKKGTILLFKSEHNDIDGIKGIIVGIRPDSDRPYVLRWQNIERDYYYSRADLEDNPYIKFITFKPEQHFNEDLFNVE